MVTIDRIRRLAKEKGIKMKFLTDSLGLNPSYFSNVETGKTGISQERIEKLAALLGTTADYLNGVTYYPYPNVSPSYWESRESYDAGLKETFEQISAQDKADRFCERCDERRIARHLTPGYVETQLHLPEDFWEDVLTGYIIPDEQTVSALAILLQTTPEYLMGLTDDPRIPSDDRTGVKIAVFGDVAAGIPLKMIDNFDPEDADSWEEINRQTAKSGTYFALKIKGDSMSPRILEGDTVIVRKQCSVESGEMAVVAINGDTATCKKIIYDEQGGMFLMSLNPAYAPKYFTAAEIQSKPVTILGKVVELRGKV